MATLLAWNQAFEKINKSNSDNKNVINKTILTNNNKTTLQTYTQIQNLGLEGILFEKIENPIIEIDKISNYIKEYNPLLFIYDPKTSEFQKGYLFGVKNIEEIKNWTKKNENDISKYEYILSPQILSTKNGFVGSVFSDGKGKIICETLHTPQISNHRNLSQGAELTNLDYIDFFVKNNFDNLLSTNINHLKQKDIIDISNLYQNKKGYFEFVKGIQNKKIGIYTTGFENISFDYRWFDSFYFNLPARCNATFIKNHL